MRSRNIKPGFWENEDVGELPYEGRLLFIGLWCLADKNGVLEDRPRRIKGQLFRYDDIGSDEIVRALDQCQKFGLIRRYEAEGLKLIHIVSFVKHQTPHANEAKSTLPPPPDPESHASADELHEVLGNADTLHGTPGNADTLHGTPGNADTLHGTPGNADEISPDSLILCSSDSLILCSSDSLILCSSDSLIPEKRKSGACLRPPHPPPHPPPPPPPPPAPEPPPADRPGGGGDPAGSTPPHKRITFDPSTNQWHGITQTDLDALSKAYPACCVSTELLRAAEWVKANPAKRKSNWYRFLVNWLSRQQDNGGTRGVPRSRGDPAACDRDSVGQNMRQIFGPAGRGAMDAIKTAKEMGYVPAAAKRSV